MHFRIVQPARDKLVLQLVLDGGEVGLSSGPFADNESAARAAEAVVLGLREGSSSLVAEEGQFRVSLRDEHAAELASGALLPTPAEVDAQLAAMRRWSMSGERFRIDYPTRWRRSRATGTRTALGYELNERSTSGRAGIELLRRTSDRLYCAHINDDDGAALVFLPGFAARYARDKRLSSLRRAAADVRRIDRRAEGDRLLFVVKARNGAELARSRWFSGANEREAAIAWLINWAVEEVEEVDADGARGSVGTDRAAEQRRRERSTYALSLRSTSGAAGFELLRGADGRHYFHFNDADGRALLHSHGYATARSRDSGMRALRRAGGDAGRYRRADGALHFVVLAGNGRELVRSRTCASEAELVAAMAWTRERVAELGYDVSEERYSALEIAIPAGHPRTPVGDSPGLVAIRAELATLTRARAPAKGESSSQSLRDGGQAPGSRSPSPDQAASEWAAREEAPEAGGPESERTGVEQAPTPRAAASPRRELDEAWAVGGARDAERALPADAVDVAEREVLGADRDGPARRDAFAPEVLALDAGENEEASDGGVVGEAPTAEAASLRSLAVGVAELGSEHEDVGLANPVVSARDADGPSAERAAVGDAWTRQSGDDVVQGGAASTSTSAARPAVIDQVRTQQVRRGLEEAVVRQRSARLHATAGRLGASAGARADADGKAAADGASAHHVVSAGLITAVAGVASAASAASDGRRAPATSSASPGDDETPVASALRRLTPARVAMAKRTVAAPEQSLSSPRPSSPSGGRPPAVKGPGKSASRSRERQTSRSLTATTAALAGRAMSGSQRERAVLAADATAESPTGASKSAPSRVSESDAARPTSAAESPARRSTAVATTATRATSSAARTQPAPPASPTPTPAMSSAAAAPSAAVPSAADATEAIGKAPATPAGPAAIGARRAATRRTPRPLAGLAVAVAALILVIVAWYPQDRQVTPEPAQEAPAESSAETSSRASEESPDRGVDDRSPTPPGPENVDERLPSLDLDDCADPQSTSLGIAVVPAAPAVGDEVRVLAATFAGEGPLLLHILRSDEGPGSAAIAVKSEAGAPASALAVWPSAQVGIHRVAARRGAGALACLEFEVVPEATRPEAPKEGIVWANERSWGAGEEALYSAWVRDLFSDATELSVPALDHLTADPERNLLYGALGLGEDRPSDDGGLRLTPDCADLPYYLRAYWAWKRRLPFAFRVCSRGELGRPPRCQRPRSNLSAALGSAGRGDELSRVQRFFQRTISLGVHTGNARAALDDQASDFYPVRLDHQSLRPGSIYADPYGHILVLSAISPEVGGGPATLVAIDGQPDGTIASKRFSEGAFLWSADGRLGGAGFKRFRPAEVDGDRVVELRDAALAELAGYGDLWRGYGELRDAAFYDAVRGVFDPPPWDPVAKQRQAVNAVAELARARVDAVARGFNYAREQPAPVRMPRGFRVFQTAGPWEDFSTPGRDLRLLIAIDVALGVAARVRERPDLYTVVGDVEEAATAVERELAALLRAPLHRVSYERSDGSTWILDLADVVARSAALESAYNPNDCPERRWGAAPGTEEYATCAHQAPATQRARMERYRRWFRRRQQPPRGSAGP